MNTRNTVLLVVQIEVEGGGGETQPERLVGGTPDDDLDVERRELALTDTLGKGRVTTGYLANDAGNVLLEDMPHGAALVVARASNKLDMQHKTVGADESVAHLRHVLMP